ncbi:MAG: hypothetical protein ACOY4K_00285 [Pseudomonadota bacterium]
MSFSESALIVGLIILVTFGGYGLYLKFQIDHEDQEPDGDAEAK